MKKTSHTYRFFSTFTLILFFSSVALPASLSAASLLCAMQQSAQGNQHASACWNMNNTDYADGLSETSTCSFQEVCDQMISDDTQYAEAIPQFTKIFAVAFVLTKISPGDTAATHLRSPYFEATVTPQNQPLFLLNSSFLN